MPIASAGKTLLASVPVNANDAENIAEARGAAAAPRVSAWPHRLAVALVCATFPLIWIGGLVTTYKAGMAAPEGFSTYGYNLFLYPWRLWLAAPWDLFIEHGHRLWADTVGIITILFVVAVWLRDSRGWMRACSLAALAGVVFQGVLGAMRVNLDDLAVARIHGCVGPAFFAFATALAVCESRRWRESGQPPTREAVAAAARSLASMARLAGATAALAYFQLLLGSTLRHVSAGMSPGAFRLAVFGHVLVAFLLAFDILWLAWRIWRLPVSPAGGRWRRWHGWLLRPAAALAMLVVTQLALGLGTWVTKYGWPRWLAHAIGENWTDGFTVLAAGRIQAWITTGHVAVGSLILATSVMLALRLARMARAAAAARTEAPQAMEAVA